MIKALQKYNIKTNKILWLIIFAVLVFYISIIISMFDPKSVKALNEMLEILPESLIKALGFDVMSTELTTFIANYIYGFLILVFPVIFTIIINNRLIAKHVDNGSMSYLLTTPNSRSKFAFNQALFSITSITLLIIAVTITAIISSNLMFPNELNINKFIYLNIYTIILYFAISGISFFASCFFSETKNSLAVGAGVPITFLVLQMLGNALDKTAWIKKLSIYGLFRPEELLNNNYSFVVLSSIIFLILAIILYTSAIITFKNKDLSI